MKKITVLSKLLADGTFADETEAKSWVMLGRVLVNEQRVASVHERISPDATVRVKEYYKRTIVSKGAVKLSHALSAFGVPVQGRVCLDCGASTGGFTDCLLSHSAARVYAVDTGFGMLAGKLRQDARVVNLERTNLGDASLTALEPPPTLVTLDLSYLSLRDAWPLVQKILHGTGEAVCLVKPIFETQDHALRRTGQINDASALALVLTELYSFFLSQGARVLGLTHSPVRGNTGVVEFFLHLSFAGESMDETRYAQAVQESVTCALALPAFSKEQI